ncbi:MAG: hypothetical protein K9M84_01655 [Spirochaetia bacterium]|nr:hypothetical protein [Spirochaetia bacterium]MCF7940291.1 hypothetical protein [Spirochaetia bacterium]
MRVHRNNRMTIYTLIMIALLLVSVQSALWSAGYEDTEVQQIYSSSEFTAFYDLIYNGAPLERINEMYDALFDWLDTAPLSEGSRLTGKARATLVMGRQHILEDYCRDHRLAANYLEAGMELLDRIPGKEPSVEQLLIEGEINGAFFLMDERKNLFTYGMKANNITQKVWKMDTDNPRSIILKSNQLIYTPSLFGGDTKKAKELLLSLLSIELLPSEAFTVYSSLGIIEAKHKNKELAEAYYRSAQEIYPNNAYIRELRDEL